MVGSISSAYGNTTTSNTKSAQQTRKEIETLIKYVNGESVQAEKPDTFISATASAAGTAAVFEGVPVAGYYINNAKLAKLTGNAQNPIMQKITEQNVEALKKLSDKKAGSLIQRIKNFISKAIDSNEQFQGLKTSIKTNVKLQQAAEKFANNPKYNKRVQKKIAKINNNIDKLNLKTEKIAEKLVSKPNSKRLKKVAEKLAKKTTRAKDTLATVNLKKGIAKAAQEGTKTVAQEGAKKGLLSKMFKSSGASVMLIFSGIIETFTEVVPTFKELGVGKGIKQTLKSGLKVVGDTIGYVLGQQAGVAAGTAIGTAIFPGVGTAIGAVCGVIGGMLGSFVAGKATKSITGPTEREIAKQQERKLQIDMTMINPIEINNLKNSALAKIQETKNTYGKLDKDSQMACNALINLNYATV